MDTSVRRRVTVACTSISTALDRMADTRRLDRVIEPVHRILTELLLRPSPAKDVLHGVWLGHPLHPALAQIPLGAAVPTALAGSADL